MARPAQTRANPKGANYSTIYQNSISLIDHTELVPCAKWPISTERIFENRGCVLCVWEVLKGGVFLVEGKERERGVGLVGFGRE